MFTSKTQVDRAYSPKGEPLFVDIKKAEIKATAVIATISDRDGVELVMQFEKSVKPEEVSRLPC